MDINLKLKKLYFIWSNNYQGPPPRSLSNTFEEYLFHERYGLFNEKWLQKVMEEFTISNKEELDEQIILIKEQYEIYALRQTKKINIKLKKRSDAHLLQCEKEGVLPF